MKNVIKKFDVRKFRKTMLKMAITACTIAMAMCSTMMIAFADDAPAENVKPSGIGGTSTMDTIVTIVFWIVRILILAIGGIPSIVKIVQGQTDENPRDRNAGIAALVVTGAAFAATFAVKALI
jgi:uncharacterized protein YneF (UPF0154 family)